MHSVRRSPEPDFLAQLRSIHSRWDELDGGERQRIRDALTGDFGEVCAYCEQECDRVATRDVPNAERVDHFRPRSRFHGDWLNWHNLIYVCRRCNDSKGNKWPGYDDAITNLMLAAMETRYTPPSEYVNPNSNDSRRPAHEFFDFDMDTAEILPANGLNSMEWSGARRTIWDIDLNDHLTDYNPSNLRYQRRYQRYLLIEGLNGRDDIEERIRLLMWFTHHNNPFSSFIRAYVANEFPGLAGQIGAV